MPTTATKAKVTTLIWAKLAPLSWPNRVLIHSAPVRTLDRRSQALRNIMRKIWLNVGHTHGSQMLLRPYMNSQVTSTIVPLMSNMPEASETPSTYQGRHLPPRK